MWYYYVAALLCAASLFCSFFVKSQFKKYSSVIAKSGLTGRQAAEKILRASGIDTVQISRTSGTLTDHYNPTNKTLALSEEVYDKASVSAIAVAAHECGHALQHAENYALVNIRQKLVPAANICSNASYIFILLGIAMDAANLVFIGAIIFSVIVLVNLVTLPVEIDASSRALRLCKQLEIFSDSEEARDGAKVLTAAGLTYFIALLSTLVTLIRYISIFKNRRRN